MSHDSDNQPRQYYEVLMRLAKSEALGRGDLESTLREVTEAAAHIMGIERVNVWLFDDELSAIRCIEHYDRSSDTHSSSGTVIAAADYPVYFRALAEERAIVADDAHQDPRTREFSQGYLDAHGITSMLDAPLHSGGSVIGIVCHEHVGPQRTWTEAEQQFAASLADFASLALESSERVRAEEEIRTLNAELEERVVARTQQLEAAVAEKEQLLHKLEASSLELLDRLCELERKSETILGDLERAQVIQQTLLPGRPPQLEHAHVDALYRPGMNVGGDLYDLARLADGKVAFYVADAAGHGVAAAMLSVLFKQRLRAASDEGVALSPADVLRRVNKKLFSDVRAQGLFVTVGYGLFDPANGELRLASAGHTPALLRRAGGEHALLASTGPALGLTRDAHYREHRLFLRQGDRLLLFTDGLVDDLGLDSEQLVEFLLPALTGDAGNGPGRLRELFRDCERRAARRGDTAGRDDVTLLMLEAAAGPSTFDNSPGEHVARSEAPRTDTPVDPALWMAQTDEETHLAVLGRGTWLDCEAFRRVAQTSAAVGHRLTVDLAGCTYLDSAFLGTLHEVVISRPRGAATVRSPCDAVRELFVELGLERVIRAILDEPAEPPCEPTPVIRDTPAGAASHRHLLRAHEILSELSDENRERFLGVVRALRRELGQPPG